MATQHGRARSKNKITHNCCNFGVMGGIAPVTGRPNAHIASRSANRNPVPCNLDCDKARKWLAGDNPLGKNMLSVNPTYSGGVGFLKKSNRKCNCGSSPSGIDMRFINYGANKFYVLIFTSAAKPDDLDAPEYWAQHYQAYLKQISLFGNSVIDHQFIWFGTPIMHISSRNGLHITYGEGQLSETEALRAQHGFITKIMPELPWSPLLVISTFQPVNQEDTLTEETRQALANLAEHPSTNVVTYHETQDISKDVVGFYGHADNAVVNQALTSILKNADKKGWITHQSWEKYADREILTVLVNHKAVSDDPQHYYFLKEHIRNLSNISVSTEDLINLNLRDINRKLYYNDTVKITMVATTYESAVYCLAWMEHYGVHHDDAIIVILDHDEDIQQLMNEERNIIASSHKVNHIPSLISAMAVGAHDLVHYKLLKKQHERSYLTGNSSATQTSTYTGTAETNWPTSSTSKFKLDENTNSTYTNSTYTIITQPSTGPCAMSSGCTEWISAMLSIFNNWFNYQIPNVEKQPKLFFCQPDVWKQYNSFVMQDGNMLSEHIYTLNTALPKKGILGLDENFSLSYLLTNEVSKTGQPNELLCQIGDKPLYYGSLDTPLTLNDSIDIVNLINSTTDSSPGVINNTELCIASPDALETLQKLIAPKYIDYSKTTTTNVYTKDQDLLHNANNGIEIFNYIKTANDDGEFGNKNLNHHLSQPIVKSTSSSTVGRYDVSIRYQFEYYYDTSGNKRWSQVSEPTVSNNFEVITVPPDIVSIVINNTLNASNSKTLGVRWYICDPNSSMMGYLAHEYPNEIHTPDSLHDDVSDFVNDRLIQWSFSFSINRDILNISTKSNAYPMLLDSIVTNNDTDNLLGVEEDGNTRISNIINNRLYTNQHGNTGLPSNKKTLMQFIEDRSDILDAFTTFGKLQIPLTLQTSTLGKNIPSTPGDFLIIPKRCVYSYKKFTDQLLPPINLEDPPSLKDMDVSDDDIVLLSEAIYYRSGKILTWIYENDIIALKNKYSSQISISMLDPYDLAGKYYGDRRLDSLIMNINKITGEIPETDKVNYVQFSTHKLAVMSLHSIYQLYTLRERHGIYKDFGPDDLNTYINTIDVDSSDASFDIPTVRFESMVKNFPGKIKQIMFSGLPAYNIFSDIGGWIGDKIIDPVVNSIVNAKDVIVDELLCPGDNLQTSVEGLQDSVLCEVAEILDGAISGKLPDSVVDSLIKDGAAGVAGGAVAGLTGAEAAALFAAFYNEVHFVAKSKKKCSDLLDYDEIFFDSKGQYIAKTVLNSWIQQGVFKTEGHKPTPEEYNEAVKKVPTIGVNTDIANAFPASLPNEKNISRGPLPSSIVLDPVVHIINNFGKEGTFTDYAKMQEGQALPAKQTYNPNKPDNTFTVQHYILLEGTLDSVELPTDYQEEQQYVTGQQTSGATNTTGIAISIAERKVLYDIIDFPKRILFRDTAFDTYTFLTPGGGMVKYDNSTSNYKWKLEDGGKLISVYGSSYPPVDNDNKSLAPDGFTSQCKKVYKMNGLKNEGQDYVLYPALEEKEFLSIKCAMWLSTGVVGGDLQRDPSDTTKYKDLSRHVDANGVPLNSFSPCLFNGAIGLLIKSNPNTKWKFYQLKFDGTSSMYGWHEVDDFFINTRIWGTRMTYNPEMVIPEKVVGLPPENYETHFDTVKGEKNLEFKLSIDVKISYSDDSNITNTLYLRDDKINVLPVNDKGDLFFIEFAVGADDIVDTCQIQTERLFDWYPKASIIASDETQYRYSEPWSFIICNEVARGRPVTTPLLSCLPKRGISSLGGGANRSANPYTLPVLKITPELLAEQGSIPSGGGGGDPFKKVRDKKTGNLFDYIKLDKKTREDLFGELIKKYPAEAPSATGKLTYVRQQARAFVASIARDGGDVSVICPEGTGEIVGLIVGSESTIDTLEDFKVREQSDPSAFQSIGNSVYAPYLSRV